MPKMKSHTFRIAGDIVEYLHENSDGETDLNVILRNLFSLPHPEKTNPFVFSTPSDMDVSDLEVGEGKLIPWRTDEFGQPRKDQRSITRSVDRQGQKLERSYTGRNEYGGMYVWRTK